MKVLILGAGAIGSYFGGMLSKKYEVTLIGREAHINAIKKNGLKITGKTNIRAYPKAFTDISESDKSDLIILTVKSYDTKKAIIEAIPYIKNSLVLSLQNGLNNEEIISKIIGENVIGGITSNGVTFVLPGEIYHAGVGETVIGELNFKITNRIKKIQKMFNSVGINCKVSKNIIGEIWAKTIVNACINPITAIYRIKNGEILKNLKYLKILEEVCMEGIEVAKKANVKLPDCDILEKTKEIARKTANNKSSMLQDIEMGKKTEIDAINGAIVEIGKKFGVPTPVNCRLIEFIKRKEKFNSQQLF